MATSTSTGNSSGSGSGSLTRQQQLQNSGSEGDLQQQVMDLRKRKRMESNRESARRSRMRKQKHLDDLMTQVNTLSKENSEIMTSINMTSQLFLNVDAENSILNVRIMELSQRLHSLEEIVNGVSIFETSHHDRNHNQDYDYNHEVDLNHHDNLVNPWNLLCVNQPIIAAANTFQY